MKRTKITTIFFRSVFALTGTTLLILSVISNYLMKLSLPFHQMQFAMILSYLIVVSIIGTITMHIMRKKLLTHIVEMCKATSDVAKRNFTVRVKEDATIEEFYTMACNFNLMTKELASVELLRNDFISNVSHEFRTPLSSIEGYVTLLQTPLLSEEKKRIYTQKILENTKRLSRLTSNILNLSNLENKSLALEKKTYSLDEQLRESVLLFENEWMTKDLMLDIELSTVTFYGNEDLMLQAWQNLIGNAIKFSNPGGKLSIHLSVEPSTVTIIISDTGIGMTKEEQKLAFDKFYQADTSHCSQGNGLGLPLTKQIIALHHGTISVASEKGKGTSFTITLPLT